MLLDLDLAVQNRFFFLRMQNLGLTEMISAAIVSKLQLCYFTSRVTMSENQKI